VDGERATNFLRSGRESASKSEGGELSKEEEKKQVSARRLQLQQLPKHYDPRSYH